MLRLLDHARAMMATRRSPIPGTMPFVKEIACRGRAQRAFFPGAFARPFGAGTPVAARRLHVTSRIESEIERARGVFEAARRTPFAESHLS
jgi:hypothetical protein